MEPKLKIFLVTVSEPNHVSKINIVVYRHKKKLDIKREIKLL